MVGSGRRRSRISAVPLCPYVILTCLLSDVILACLLSSTRLGNAEMLLENFEERMRYVNFSFFFSRLGRWIGIGCFCLSFSRLHQMGQCGYSPKYSE